MNDQAAVWAEAREQLRRAPAVWLPGDRTGVLGRQLVLSITRHRPSEPAVTDLGGGPGRVEPALWGPITTVPEGWPLAPAVCGGGSSGRG